ncbi:MAG: hypothetical protein EHM34_02640 [Nitrosopumilales archaeon]|nr:MAG: hypothetical protein EHM34_02640 [Nitrosopumilales archaeon]
MNTCYKCGISLNTCNCCADSSRKSGLSSKCKKCANEARKNRVFNKPEHRVHLQFDKYVSNINDKQLECKAKYTKPKRVMRNLKGYKPTYKMTARFIKWLKKRFDLVDEI